MRTRTYILGISIGALALLGAGCGDDTSCGAGTVEMNGTCVPAADACGDNATFNEETGECEGNACATGTTLIDGECVPDGSVVCADGTSYDEGTGTCVPDISECGEGTVLVDGVCVPWDDAVTADVQELPEPNSFPDDNAGQFTTPEIGENVTITGCINPYEDTDDNGNLDPDFDAYYFAVTGPTLLNVTVDGLNGLSGGFAVLTGDEELFNAGWQRLGVNVVDDVASRQVFLPKAGVYALGVSDGRSILLAEGFGGPETCYLATVERLAIPTPTAMTGQTATGDLGDIQFYSYDVNDGDILFPELVADSAAASPSLVVQVNTAFRSNTEGDFDGGPAATLVGDVADADTLVFAVDYFINYSLSAVPYTLTVDDPDEQALPTDGSVVTVTHDNGFYSWLYFDVANAGDVLRMQLAVAPGDIQMQIIDPITLTFVGELCAECASADEWVHFTRAGTYYMRVYDFDLGDETPAPTYDITSTVSAHTPAAVTVGTPNVDELLSDDEANWYSIDVESIDWLVTTGDPDTLAGAIAASLYDRTVPGVIDNNLISFDAFEVASTTDEVGRIIRGAVFTDVLIRVVDGGGGGGGSSFDFTVAERDFTAVDADEAVPVDLQDVALAADATHYYLVASPEAGYRLETTAAGTGCMTLAELDFDESWLDSDFTDGGPGPALNSLAGARLWTAYAVEEGCSAADTYDFQINATAPVTYTATAGTLAFSDICGGGANEISLSSADDGLASAITLTPSFSMFGEAATEFTVSSNGWLTLETGYAGSSFAHNELGVDDGRNFIVAPFDADLDQIAVCVVQDSTSATIQWTGISWWTGDGVEFQAILHDDGSIDFIYGAGNVDSSDEALIGIEDSTGVGAEVISEFTAGAANPGTSWTLTVDP